MTIIITVESEEHKNKILQVLEDAEMDGVLDFWFNVQLCNQCGVNADEELKKEINQIKTEE